jgi:hypothetical protein
VTDPARWLDERDPPMPDTLRAAVDAALAAAGEGPAEAAPTTGLPELLATAALRTLERVAAAEPERATAPALLAADALLTFACEAAAEDGPAAVDRVVEALDADRFGRLLERGSR